MDCFSRRQIAENPIVDDSTWPYYERMFWLQCLILSRTRASFRVLTAVRIFALLLQMFLVCIVWDGIVSWNQREIIVVEKVTVRTLVNLDGSYFPPPLQREVPHESVGNLKQERKWWGLNCSLKLLKESLIKSVWPAGYSNLAMQSFSSSLLDISQQLELYLSVCRLFINMLQSYTSNSTLPYFSASFSSSMTSSCILITSPTLLYLPPA